MTQLCTCMWYHWSRTPNLKTARLSRHQQGISLQLNILPIQTNVVSISSNLKIVNPGQLKNAYVWMQQSHTTTIIVTKAQAHINTVPIYRGTQRRFNTGHRPTTLSTTYKQQHIQQQQHIHKQLSSIHIGHKTCNLIMSINQNKNNLFDCTCNSTHST